MATSGSFDTTHRVSGSYDTYAHFAWSQTSQSIANNTTSISWTFTGKTANQYQWVYVYGASVTVDGTTKSGWTGEMYNGTQMLSGTKTITHNSDGTKTLSASGYVTQYASNTNYSGSGSWTLNTIARKATVSSAPNFNDEDSPTITYENKAGNSATTLQACITNSTGTTSYANYRDITKTGTSYQFNLTTTERNALRNAIPSANSMKVRFYIKTVIGSSTFYDYKEVTFSITNANPTFSNFTYADTNSTTTGITGNNQYLIQNKSTLRATITAANKATANKGATMSQYDFAIGGYSGTATYSTSDINKDIGTLSANVDQTLSITARDSRGNTKTAQKTVHMVPYATPVLNASATRANNFEANTTISVSGSISLLKVNNVVKNTVNSTSGVQYRYKAQSTSTWGSWTNIASTLNTSTGAVTTSSFVLSLDNTQSFDFQFRMTDVLETRTVSIVVSQGQPQFFIGSDGRVCVGGTPSNSKRSGENGHLEVKGTVYTTQQLQGSKGGAWWQSRDNAVARNANTYTNSTYAPVVSAKSNSGDWSIGCLKNDTTNKLYFSFCSDTNYNNANNTTSYRYIDTAGRSTIYPLFPVGSIFMTTTQTTVADVQAVLAGTWERFGQGKVLVGVDTNDTDFNAANKTGGAKTVTLTTDQIPSHHHSTTAAGSRGKAQAQTSGTSGYAWNADSGSVTGNTGGGKAHQNMPPYITVYMYRRTA